MVYQPTRLQDDPYNDRFTSPPPRRHLARPASNSALTTGIRSVRAGSDHSHDHPPSFHSHYAGPPDAYDGPANGLSQHGRYDDEEDYSEVQLERAYQAQAQADLVARLQSPYYDDRRQEAEGEEADHFEDSFEGAEEWDEKREIIEDEEAVGSPALSFAGGFGAPPPTAHLRRNLTTARVKLTQGNLVLDCKIPSRLAGFLPRKGTTEFDETRYTAITCGPEDFNRRHFTLRQTIYNRQTQLMIIITLYNESEELFCRTMHGVMKNIAQLCKRKKSQTWGDDGWKKVVVCVVADGRKAINPRVLDCLAALGVYQEGLATNQIDSETVQAHLYEYTTQMSISPDLTFKGLEKGIVPTQVMFLLKEKNAKKLNSHRWALEALAPQLDPNVVMLIDAGTKPQPASIYHLWKAFDLNSNVGGACGEITVKKNKFWLALANPLVAAQNFEYKISNILDKPLESFCGYIGVLPGAFSAYRMRALKNDELGHGPLNSYFKGEHLASHDADVFTNNMYLAEDRILCWELVAKRGDAWVLKYIKSAQGETDVPDTIAEFISQRRRWLNGSFFASTYALRHTMALRNTSHSRKRVFVLFLQAIYNCVHLLFAWLAMGNFWIFYMVLTTSLEDPAFGLKHIDIANTIMQSIYMGTVVACFLLSMGNRPKAARWAYMGVIGCFSLTTTYMFAAAVYCTIHAIKHYNDSAIFAQLVVSLVSTYGCYVVASLLHFDPWHLVTSMPQYLLLSATYINLLNIFAFSNLHDFSWGTKEQTTQEVDLGVIKRVGNDAVDIQLPAGQTDIDVVYDMSLHNLKTRPMIVPPPLSEKAKEEAMRDYYASVRTNVVLVWVLSNALLVTTILKGNYSTTLSQGGGNGRTQIYLLIILIFVAIMSLIRFIGSTAYVIDRAIRVVGGRIVSATRKTPSEKGPTAGRVGGGRRFGRGIGSESGSEQEKREAEEEEVVQLSAGEEPRRSRR